MTHTYAILEISAAAYAEIRARLQAAGYEHAFHDDLIDMHGIALKAEAAETAERERIMARQGQPCTCGVEEGRFRGAISECPRHRKE